MTQTTKRTAHAIFSPSRFGRYARAHFSEKARPYGWHFAIIAMLYFMIELMMLSQLNGDKYYHPQLQQFFYYAGLLTTGSIFAVRYFSSLARSESALLVLMQPVSTFEKWLLAAVTILLLYPLLYTLCFWLMTLPTLPSVDRLFIPLYGALFKNDFYEHFYPQVITCILYLGFTGYALATSILFHRLPMIKSLALGFALFLIFLFSLMTFRPTGGHLVLFTVLPISTFALNNIIASTLAWIVTPALLWLSSFFLLKERDLS